MASAVHEKFQTTETKEQPCEKGDNTTIYESSERRDSPKTSLKRQQQQQQREQRQWQRQQQQRHHPLANEQNTVSGRFNVRYSFCYNAFRVIHCTMRANIPINTEICLFAFVFFDRILLWAPINCRL